MSIRAFRTLSVVARHGTFARAGEVIGLTQSAVSLQMKTLEQEFGVQIFDRSRKRPELTEAGKIVLEKATEILTLYDQIGSALSDEQSLAGRLRLGATETVLNSILPDAIATLHRLHPRVRVHVSGGMSTDLAAKIVNGELDVAVTSEPARSYSKELVWRPLYQDQFWIVAPAGNEQTPLNELLTKYPFISLGSSAWAGQMVLQELRRQKVDFRQEMILDSPEVILRMVQNGLGVSVIALPDNVRDRAGITCIPFGSPPLMRQMVLLEHYDRKTGALSDALAAAVLEHQNSITAA